MLALNSIVLGDCLEKMVEIPDKSIDCIITDLPYGTLNLSSCQWDVIIPFDKLWNHYNRIIKPNGAICLFGQEPFSSYLRISNIKNYKYDWYWEKERLTNIFQVKRRPGKVVETISVFYQEQCLYNPQKTIHTGPLRTNKIKEGKLGKLVDNGGKTPTEYKDNGTRNPIEILKFKRDILTSNLHPTQKPLLLIEHLIKTYTNKGDTVLDSCAGSFTTAIAADNLSRNWIGIEKELKFCEIGLERINKNRGGLGKEKVSTVTT